MKIKHLKLENYRNYEKLELDLSDTINIFVGNNGQGKTNILESIYVLSLTKSNRPGLDSDLIMFDKPVSRIEGTIYDDSLIKKLSIEISKLDKKTFINNKEIKKTRDYVSNFCVVSFNPVDLEIIKGSPNIRRNILNIDISQIYNNYITYLNEFNSINKYRNDYLKKLYINANSDSRYLDAINEKLIEKADKIYEFRYMFLNNINSYLNKVYKKITNLDGLKLCYDNSIGLDEYNKDTFKEIYLNKLKKNLKKEMELGMTLIGPHRDDFKFMLNDMDLKLFGSQGQQRMAIIAFKICELKVFKKILGSYPVLLLDDIFSEIDSKKRSNIIKFLKDDIQTIITTTDLNDISNSLIEDALIYNINKGKITKKGKINNGRRKS